MLDLRASAARSRNTRQTKHRFDYEQLSLTNKYHSDRMMVDAGMLHEGRSAAHATSLRTSSNVNLSDPPKAGSPEAKALAAEQARKVKRAGTGFDGADPNRPSARSARAKFTAAGTRPDPGANPSWLYAPWAADSTPEKAVNFSLTRKQKKVSRLLDKKRRVREEIARVREQIEATAGRAAARQEEKVASAGGAQ